MLKTSSGLLPDGHGATNRTYLPLSNDTCSNTGAFKCFFAGEYRTSENLGLVSMHTLFNREHNRIAGQLLKINPTWTDDKIYFETRRIVIAQMQHVVYNEWLPIINGDLSLSPLKNSTYFTGYDKSVNIFNGYLCFVKKYKY
jgi:peroxidase